MFPRLPSTLVPSPRAHLELHPVRRLGRCGYDGGGELLGGQHLAAGGGARGQGAHLTPTAVGQQALVALLRLEHVANLRVTHKGAGGGVIHEGTACGMLQWGREGPGSAAAT